MGLANRLRRFRGRFAGALILMMGGVLVLAALQRQLIYYPEVAAEDTLLRIAAKIGLQGWRDAGGQLIGWRTRAAGKGARRVVVLHGNAGHALYREYFAAGFLAQGDDWEVYLFEYPGYGARPGSPSETNIKRAATDALEALFEENQRPLYLVGESLGSGVAAWLAGTFPAHVAGLLLVTPFTNLPDVASQHYALLPVRALLSERYDSQKALGGYAGPVAFLIAGSDEIIPPALGRKLYDGYRGPKWLREQAGAGHNTLDLETSAPWWSEAVAFLLRG
jgi:pimeloyl-ACP methyl ester carboxylesterase